MSAREDKKAKAEAGNWSYQEITAKAEEKIRYFMEKSREARDEFYRNMFSDWAYGVYAGWAHLVGAGFSLALEDDRLRLEGLTKHDSGQ